MNSQNLTIKNDFNAHSRKLAVNMRWLTRPDMPHVLHIERSSYASPWSYEDFACFLKQKPCIGMVAEIKRPRTLSLDQNLTSLRQKLWAVERTRDINGYCTRDISTRITRLQERIQNNINQVVGFMVYELHATGIDLHNFTVDPDFRNHYVGQQMTLLLMEKLSLNEDRQEILLNIRESNLDGQLFFRKQEFRGRRVVREHYEDTGEDAYIMQFRLDGNYEDMPDHTLRDYISEAKSYSDHDFNSYQP